MRWYDKATRQRAVRALLRAGKNISKSTYLPLLTGGDPDALIGIRHAWTKGAGRYPPSSHLLLRQDLTDTHLDQILADVPTDRGIHLFSRGPAHFWMWLATYPTARTDQRTTAAANARKHIPEGHPYRPLLDALEDLDPTDTAAVTTAGRAIPLLDETLQHLPGIQWLVRTTLVHHLGPDTTPGTAHVLVLLATTAEPLTLAQLLDTATTISTPA